MLAAADLHCTNTGQVSSATRSKSVAQLNAERFDRIAPGLPPKRNAGEFEIYRSEMANRIRRITRVGAFKAEYGIEVPSRFLDAGVYAKGAAFLIANRARITRSSEGTASTRSWQRTIAFTGSTCAGGV